MVKECMHAEQMSYLHVMARLACPMDCQLDLPGLHQFPQNFLCPEMLCAKPFELLGQRQGRLHALAAVQQGQQLPGQLPLKYLVVCKAGRG